MAFETLREQIKTMLQSNTSIQEIHDYPSEDFNGFPAAVIRSAGNDSDYETTAENERHYIFEVFIFQESESALRDRRQARRIIEGIADEMLDLFDDDEYMSGISMPSDKTMIGIIPVTSEIVDLDKYVAMKAILTVKVIVDVTT